MVEAAVATGHARAGDLSSGQETGFGWPLRDMGVTPLLDLPGVGANLQDHPFATVTYRARKAVPVIHANPVGEAMGFVRTDAALEAPDQQFVLCAHPIPVPTCCRSPNTATSIAFSIMSPHSGGSVRLASADPGALPVVDPNYLGADIDDADTDALRRYLRLNLRCYFHYVGTARIGADAMDVETSSPSVRRLAEILP